MEEEGEEEGSSSDLLHPLSSFRAIGRRIEATRRLREFMSTGLRSALWKRLLFSPSLSQDSL